MTILHIIFALIALGLLVFIHELGHYFVAKWVGMKVETFSIGFGKPILKWKRGGVDWQLAVLPFGGFVKIAGTEFGKKDQNNLPIDPYAVEGGFFQKSPFKRILVAIAGPSANFLLALIIFSAIYLMGGREKTFSEYTKIIGWVDPESELYQDQVKPGDLLQSLNGRPYTNVKDLLYAAMLGGERVKVTGSHVNYLSQEKTPFSYTIKKYLSPLAIDDIYTTGISSGAKFLIYSGKGSVLEGSPMEGSGIQEGDRLVWADGETLFSQDQLSHLLNDGRALLTIKRKEETFFSRQKRQLAGDLLLPSHLRNELQDWQYEAGVKGKWQHLYILPYMFSGDATVVGSLNFVDEECKKESFAHLETPLQVGDRIVAVDGFPVNSGTELTHLLQVKHVNVIVAREPFPTKVCWRDADHLFMQGLNQQEIDKIVRGLGTKNPVRQAGNYVLLNPVVPKRITQFALSEETKAYNAAQYQAEKKRIEEVKSPTRRAKMLEILARENHKYLLGAPLHDQAVNYNPNPFVIFGQTVAETWMTLKALIMGYLNPKWLAGPIGIVQVIQHGWKAGFSEALFWIGAISVNLGMLNLLPIPVLDGGYICLSLWEMITRRRLKPRTMERLIVPFVVLLMGLFLFLTFQDISRLF